jgi:hypothetical protein
MTFYALAICVCLAVMFLAWVVVSLLLWLLRGIFTALLRSWAPETAARVLFTFRILPVLLALGLTLGLALPAFLEFEPRYTSETMRAKLLLLSAAGAITLMAMAIRGLRVLQATRRAERIWRAGCEENRVNAAGTQLPLYYVEGSPGLVAVAGFFRPRLFVAKEVAQMLSPDELSAALAHEIAHVSCYDNLKQLLLKITRPPRWLGGEMDDAWTNASEVAADEAALAKGASALDLAAALVKVGSLQRLYPAVELVAASHLLAGAMGSAMEIRVARLQKALQDEVPGPKIRSGGKQWRIIGTIALPLAYVAAIITLLPAIHEALEFLVR